MSTDAAVVPDGPILVAAWPEVGSEDLALALAQGDLAAMGSALRRGFVIVPSDTADGEPVHRLYPSPDGPAELFDLCLFSSAQALAAFAEGDGDAVFTWQRGLALLPFLEDRSAAIDQVHFDPAGPHPLSLPGADVVALVTPGEDDVEWILAQVAEAEATLADLRRGRVTAYDVNLTKHWATISLHDEAARQRQIRQLVKDRTTALGDRGAPLRRDMVKWFTQMAERAAEAHGRKLAFLVARTDRAAAALSLVTYWHELSGEPAAAQRMDDIQCHVERSAHPEDDLLRVESRQGELLRHSRIGEGAPEVGGSHVRLLMIDYWLAAPDDRGIAQLSFATPHVDARDTITLLADNVVLGGRWITDNCGGPASDETE
jgi:hypothetical protein